MRIERGSRRPWRWIYEVDNLGGLSGLSSGAAASSPGTAMQAGANDVDGSVVTMISSLAQDVHFIEIALAGFQNAAGNDVNAMADILIDAAGGTPATEIIADLGCGLSSTPSVAGGGYTTLYRFPLLIKAGASVGARVKWHHTSASTNGRIYVRCFGTDSDGERHIWCGSRVETLGAGGNSSGTAITPGNSGTYGSWTSVGGTTGGRYGWLEFGVTGADGNMVTSGYYFQVGAGSQRLAGAPTVYFAGDSNELGSRATFSFRGVPCDIPSGAQLQVRATQSASGTDTPNVCLYGVI